MAVPILIIGGLSGCFRSRIISVYPERGAPGDTFTIYGTHLKEASGLPVIPPRLRRCDEFSLEILDLDEDHIRVRIPANVPAAVYQVYAWGEPGGAYQRSRTNSLPFWVTAAPVSYDVHDNYEVQVKSFRSRYGKDPAWEAWMLANRARYENVFAAAHALPCPLKITAQYEPAPLPLVYNPPWTSEAEHMAALGKFAEGGFPGYHFEFIFAPDAPGVYGQAILGHIGDSYASGRTVYLHWETIFNHEFSHVLSVLHHYDDNDERTIGRGLNFPPGESGCIQDRNENQFCSACRTALNIPLDVDRFEQLSNEDISRRYPPGW